MGFSCCSLLAGEPTSADEWRWNNAVPGADLQRGLIFSEGAAAASDISISRCLLAWCSGSAMVLAGVDVVGVTGVVTGCRIWHVDEMDVVIMGSADTADVRKRTLADGFSWKKKKKKKKCDNLLVIDFRGMATPAVVFSLLFFFFQRETTIVTMQWPPSPRPSPTNLCIEKSRVG